MPGQTWDLRTDSRSGMKTDSPQSSAAKLGSVPGTNHDPGGVNHVPSRGMQAFAAGAGNGGVAHLLLSERDDQTAAENADSGAPLSPDVRAEMEAGFGTGLGHIRVHADNVAAQSAVAIHAAAFTVGNHIYLGRNHFQQDTRFAKHLLAHELAHVLQQQQGGPTRPETNGAHECNADRAAEKVLGGGTNVAVGPGTRTGIARNPDDKTSQTDQRKTAKQEGAGQSITPVRIGGRTYSYLVWGQWQRGDDLTTFRTRVFTKWVAWRFRGIKPAESQAVITYLQSRPFMPFDTTALKPESYYSLPMENGVVVQARVLSGEPAREKAEEQGGGTGDARDTEKKSAGGVGTGDTKDKEKSGPGEVGDPHGEKSFQVIGRPEVLAGNAALAKLYIGFLQRYAAVTVDPKQAEHGLTSDQIKAITAGNDRAREMTDLFTQGWTEYRATGGDDVITFGLMEEALFTQRDRGNFTALHNQLEISSEHEGLGLYKRGTIVRYYDSSGQPVPTNVGDYRDPGYRAAAPSSHAAQIAITDPGLLKVLGGIKNVTLDVAVLAYQAAKGFWDNGDLLYPAVCNGWDRWGDLAEEMKRQLEGVIFFLGLEGIAVVLKKLPHQWAIVAGELLEQWLEQAGKLFKFVLGFQLAKMLFEIGLELSKIQRQEGSNDLDALSQAHLQRAAVKARELLTLAFATGLTVAAIAAARQGVVNLGEPPSGPKLAPARAGGPNLKAAPQVKGAAVPAPGGSGPKIAIPQGPSSSESDALESRGSGADDKEEGTKPRERAPSPEKSAVREQAKKKLSAVLDERAETQAAMDRLNDELSNARAKVNRLRKQIDAAESGSKARADLVNQHREAQEALKEIQESGGVAGHGERLAELNKAEEAILESLALKRPSLWQKTKDAIRAAAKKNANDEYLDANSGEVIKGEPEFGHIRGKEHRRLVLEASRRGMNQEQFNKWVNEHPEWFQLETWENNRSHRYEKKGVEWEE